MSRNISLSMCAMVLIMGVMSACGGSETSSARQTVVTLTLQGGQAGAQIGAIDAVCTLPDGVSVKSSVPPTTDSGVVAAAAGVGTNPLIAGSYYPSSKTLRVSIVSDKQSGFSAGAFATVTCDVSPSYSQGSLITNPTATVWDVNGAVMTGLSLTISAL